MTIDGPHTLSRTPPPPDIYADSDTVPPGETKQIEKAHEGASTVATYTVTRNGEVINKQVFESKYKALPAQFLRGPQAPAPAEQPAEATTTEATTDTTPTEQGEVAGAQDPAPAPEPAP